MITLILVLPAVTHYHLRTLGHNGDSQAYGENLIESLRKEARAILGPLLSVSSHRDGETHPSHPSHPSPNILTKYYYFLARGSLVLYPKFLIYTSPVNPLEARWKDIEKDISVTNDHSYNRVLRLGLTWSSWTLKRTALTRKNFLTAAGSTSIPDHPHCQQPWQRT